MAGRIIKVPRPSKEEIEQKLRQSKEVFRKMNSNQSIRTKGGISKQNDDSFYQSIEDSIKIKK